MDDAQLSRRNFLGGTAGVAGATLLPTTALSYSRIVGANDRIQIGQIGSGHRHSVTAAC